jgi:hypothetical protein
MAASFLAISNFLSLWIGYGTYFAKKYDFPVSVLLGTGLSLLCCLACRQFIDLREPKVVALERA